jgi:uncharacterized protein involved in outer membrane biogenesis
MTADVMRSKRGCLIALSVAAVILLCGAFVVYRALDPNALRGVAERHLTELFGEPVTIGRMRVSLFPVPAVTGTDIRLGSRTAAAAPSVDVGRIRILPQWRTLLSKPIVVDAVEVERLAVSLRRDRDGRWILPGTGAARRSATSNATGASTPSMSGGASTETIAVRHIRLRAGRLGVVDDALRGVGGAAEVAAITEIDGDLEEGPGGTAAVTMRAKIGASPVTGRIDSGPQGLAAKVQAPSLGSRDLPVLFALLGSRMPAGLSIGGKAPLDLALRIARDTGALTASGRLQAGSVAFGTLTVTNVTAPFRVASDVLTIEPLTLSTYGGAGRSRLRVQYGTTPVGWMLDSRVDGLDLNAFLSANTTARDRLLGTGRIAGRLQGTAQPPVERRIGGTLDVTVSNGVIRNFPLLAGLNRALQITGGDTNDTKFQRLSATVEIARGVMRTGNAVLEAGELTTTAAGTMTFERAIDMAGTAIFSREASARMIATVKHISGAKNERGEVEVPFTITGTTDRPQFSVNMEQILRRAAQKEIQRNLKKGLEQLFRKPKP